jgi:hypothetical protein
MEKAIVCPDTVVPTAPIQFVTPLITAREREARLARNSSSSCIKLLMGFCATQSVPATADATSHTSLLTGIEVYHTSMPTGDALIEFKRHIKVVDSQ